jgi:transposase-like protein
MEQLVERWRGSDGSLTDFARKHGVSRDKLAYWRRRLAGSDGAVEVAALAPVRLIGPAPTHGHRLEVVLGTGDRVLVPENTPVELLHDVVTVLRGC